MESTLMITCRFRVRLKAKAFQYLRCGAKTVTFLFWASLYMVVMKMTIFKSSVNTPVVKDWSMVPDNYTKWLLQDSALEEPEVESNNMEWVEPDKETVAELERRAAQVQNVCQQRALYTQPVNSKEFFVDHAHNIVWCNIFKAASSSWLYKFNILGGYDKRFLSRTRQLPLMLARKKFPRPSEEELLDAVNTPGVISLLVVREPFVRLLSAYRDKLENIKQPYYRKLARAIIAEQRDNATKILGLKKGHGPTFYEFIAYLIKNHKSQVNAPEFDEHWSPYYQFCSPCAVNFSVVAKVETLARDSSVVIQQLGLGHVLGKKVNKGGMRLRTVMNKSRDGKDTNSLMKRYFSQLDEKMLNGLLQIYGIDFEMFGYDLKVYSHYVRK